MHRRRPAALAVLALAGALVVSGCNTASLSKQELVVYFGQNAPSSDHLAALKACGKISPEVTPEKFYASKLPSNNVGDVRFLTDHADDKEVAQVENCLYKQPGVIGVDVPDLTD